MIAWLLGVAIAAPVAATVRVDGEHVSAETARSVVWHALAAAGDPILLGDDPRRAVGPMSEALATTLFDVEVVWKRDALWLDARIVWADAPVIRVTEYVLRDGALSVAGHREVVGEPEAARTDTGWLLLHERSLARAVAAALHDLEVPAWGGAEAPLRVPTVVAADEEFRTRYGARWQDEASERLARASALLGPAGIALDAVEIGEWTSPGDATTPVALLEELAGAAVPDRTLRIGLSGQGAELLAGATDDVGAAWVPGRHLVVLDHGPGTAYEAIAVAHEVLHALGVPHPDAGGLLMSPTLSGAVHRLDPASRELARAAAQARWAHWDPEAAAVLLADAAATWIDDPDLRLAYVARNLAAGQGVEHPDRPWAALAREALGEPLTAE